MSTRFAFLDLDGPLLDVAPRYHALHHQLVTTRGGRPLPAGEYWRRKRDRVSERAILSETGLVNGDIDSAVNERLALIETIDWLARDRLWDWSRSVLGQLSNAARVVLVTQRSHEDRLRWQLRHLDIDQCFEHVVCGRGDDTDTAKAGLVRAAGFAADPSSVMVGDTEVDLRSAQALGVWAVGVRTGIRNDEALLSCKPAVLLDDLRDVPAWLRAQGWTSVAQ